FFQRAARARRQINCLVPAAVLASRLGAHGRHLYAAGAGRLVRERCQVARIEPMAALDDIIAKARRVDGHRPWPRAVVTPEAWRVVTGELAAGHATLLGLWGDTGAVHMAVMSEVGHDINVVSVECPDGSFPSVGALHPPAIRLERAIKSLYGL